MKYFFSRAATLAVAPLLFSLFFLTSQVHGQPSNGVYREVYTGIGGNAISDLTGSPNFPNNPSVESLEPIFEGPTGWSDNYGTRMRALVTAPLTGNYIFWISTDDNGQLFLGTDATPATKRLICAEPQWAGSRDWNGSIERRTNATSIFPAMNPNLPANRSDYAYGAITLTAGQNYYIEALQKEGTGGDNIAVAWQLPNGTFEGPIPQNRLMPYGLGPPVITRQPTNTSVVEGGMVTFSISLDHMLGAVFQWMRNSTNIPSATNNTLTLGPVTLADTTNRFKCYAANAYGNTNSTEAVLTVLPDVTRPTISTVGNLGEPEVVFVVFSEPVEAASATNTSNYTINNGISVLRAAFGVDSSTIILTTTPIPPNITNTLTINNVRDRATTPNTILANSTRTFSLSIKAIDPGFLTLPREPIGPSSRRHGVVISEVMYHPTNRTDGRNLEFIEIYNSQPWFQEIGVWRISGAIDYVFPSNIVLAARSYAVVAANPTDLRATYPFTNVFGPFLGSNGLQNSSGSLRLRNDRDAVLFEMEYNGDPPFPASADGAGHSLVLARPSYGERDPRAWAASEVAGGTPGAADGVSSAYKGAVINEILAHTDLPEEDYIEIYNYSSFALNMAGCALTDDPDTNKFIIPPNTILGPRTFLAFTETQLGFSLSSGGETVFLKAPTGGRVIDSLRFDAQENGVAWGRYPDGAANFSRLLTPTLGTNNVGFKPADVVINEIMFDPISSNSDDEYIELYNRGTNAVNLGGWHVRGGISYNIPNGTTLAAGGYLVIARNATHLRANYPNLTAANTLGDFSGSLANGGERIALNFPDEVISTNSQGQPKTNTIHIMIDEVTYGPGGRWGQWAAGGGSSLELRDSRADRRLAPNWGDSDESAKSQWVNVEATGVMDNGWADAYQLHITLLGAGECLLDNIEVIPNGSTNVIANGTFESSAGGWVFQGNHNDSSWETGSGYNSSRSLHLVAAGRGDSGANRIRAQLPYTLAPGTTVTLRAKARWLKGNPNLLLRLRGNWLEAPGNILTAANLGTPGAVNSRAVPNVGPAITDVRHEPALPAASQPVLVVARVNDPDGLAYLAVSYRIDPNTSYTTLAMTNNGAGLYSMVIPGQASGVTAAFYIQAMDNFAPPATSSFPNDAPARECVVRWGDNAVPGTLGLYRFWITQTNINRWVAEEKMSNKPKDVSFIYGTNRIVYNAGAWFHGSPYHSPGYDSPIGAGCDYDMAFPEDDRLLGETDINLFRPGNGGGDGTAQAELHGYWFGDQLKIPFLYCRPVFVYVNGLRRETAFYDAQQPNGDYIEQWFPDDKDGELHKVALGFEFGDLAYGANEPGYAAVGADLNRYTTTGGRFKQARYRQTWPLRSVSPFEQNDYTNLFALVDIARTSAPIGSDAYTATLMNNVDVEEWFKVHITQHLFNNGDSFSYGGGQNAFVYKPQSDTWKFFLWDIDFAFGGDPNDPNLFAIGGAEHGPRNDHPPFRRIYWQALIEAANGMLTSARSDTILDARYNGMVAGGAGVGSPSGIKSFIATRRNLVLSQIAANQSPFAINSNGGADFTTNRNLINLTGTAPLEVRTILVNGVPYPVTWTTLNTWVIRIPLVSGLNVLQITGLNPKGVPVAGVNGTIRVTYTGVNELPQDKIVINEIMYNPVFADASFVEIYNSSVSNAFDMSLWRLDGIDFKFANGVIIEPGAYLVLAKDRFAFAGAYGNAISVFAEFAGNLDNGGETLTLVKPGPTPSQDMIIDQVTYDDDLPWSAIADGTGASLQLIDPAQDNNRVANWAAVPTNAPPPAPQWVYVTAPGVPTTSLLYLYLQSAGDVYVDDIKIVPGNIAETGVNSVQNGDFESAFPGPWTVSANHSASVVSTATKHSGNASLHVIASAGGTTQGSAIWQNLSPALTNGQPYTLSFWYLQSTNGGPLTIRLSGSGIITSVNIAPPGGGGASRFTPGAINSVRATLPSFPTLWLNEVLPNNVFSGTNGIMDAFGDRDPWLELYNGGTNSISLGGYYLANNYTNLTQWAFPSNSVINPKEFLIVWLDGETNESTNAELHVNFRAVADIGSVVLSRGAGLTNVLDYFNYSIPTIGRSYGSFPDGSASGRRLFAIVTPGATNNATYPPIDVRINEWMADNLTTVTNSVGGDFDDWFEIYNPGTNTVDLTGCFLSDNLANKTQSPIENGTTIPPQGYLLVWADNTTGRDASGNLHASFKLSKASDSIGLFGPDGTLIDGVSFGGQATDVSQGRFPDGNTAVYAMTNYTPRAANFLATSNNPPTMASIGNKSVDEGSELKFTVVASDTNEPPQTLTFSLAPGAPSGATINSGDGLFKWTPAEAQGPGVYSVTFVAADNGSPSMVATQTISITVNEVNNAPVLAPVLSRNINEGASLTVTNSAVDPDDPPQLITFSLDPGSPAGMLINASNGTITWTPTEAQGPGTYSITVRATDNGSPAQSSVQTFSVSVAEINSAPHISFPANWRVHAESMVAFTATGTDTDLPAQSMTFSIGSGAPSGTSIDPATGEFMWIPSVANIGTNNITLRVTDSGSPALFALSLLKVIVDPPFHVTISRDGETISISFDTMVGRTYHVEYKDDLANGWTSLNDPQTANSTSLSVQDSMAGKTQRFYRIVEGN